MTFIGKAVLALERWLHRINCPHKRCSPRGTPYSTTGVEWVCDECGKVIDRDRWL